MPQCPECDQEVDEGERVCPNCGAILDDDAEEGSEGFEA